MIIRMLFVQTKEDYNGQYAPELLASVDEYTDTENPGYFEDKIKDAQQRVASGELSLLTS